MTPETLTPILDPATCAHPKSAYRYADSQTRDAHGRLLSSRRAVSCQLCGHTITDTTHTWEPREEASTT